MRTLWVVTHPEATHHLDDLVGGWFDSSLTEVGRRHAELIAGELRRRIPTTDSVSLHTSDLNRTVETARVIGQAFTLEPSTDPDLREKSYGEAEGRPQAWLDERFVPPPKSGDRMRHVEGIAGSETKHEFATRVFRAVDTVLASPTEHQIIVTHGYALTFVIANWINMPIDSCGYVNFRASSGSITELREDDYFANRQVAVLNSTGHLNRPE
jgi:probable phosphoglycerate mutase